MFSLRLTLLLTLVLLGTAVLVGSNFVDASPLKAHAAWSKLLPSWNISVETEKFSFLNTGAKKILGAVFQTHTTPIIGDIGLSSDSIPCPQGTRGLGVVTSLYSGSLKKETGPLQIRLCQIPDIAGEGNDTQGVEISGGAVVSSRVAGAWLALGKRARADGTPLTASSSFRLAHSCGGTGVGTGCATPGASLHQLGVAIDFGGTYVKGTCTTRCSCRAIDPKSPEWVWLYRNAGHYGFYQYTFESWHWDPLESPNRCGFGEPLISEIPPPDPGTSTPTPGTPVPPDQSGNPVLGDGLTHTICKNLQCAAVLGPGINQCDRNSDCRTSHTTCSGTQCIRVPEPGKDECIMDPKNPSKDNSLIGFPGKCPLETHFECVNRGLGAQCAVVPGPGDDQCTKETELTKCGNADIPGSSSYPTSFCGINGASCQCVNGALPIDPAAVKRFNGTVHTAPGSGHGWAVCGSGFCAVDLNAGTTAEGAYQAALAGVSIYSPINGTVTAVKPISYGTGSCITISGGNNTAELCHVDSLVSPGATVTAGQQVAKLTAYHGDFGPHLHFELQINGRWIMGDGKEGTWTNQQAALGCSG